MSCLNILKATVARILFAFHGLISVWRVVDVKKGDKYYWYISAMLAFLVVEGLLAICKRQGKELKWFCPSVFVFLCCALPPIWILELELAEERIMKEHGSNSETEIPEENSGSSIPSLQNILGITLNNELWTKVLEQTLLVILIVGRWLLPKGELTRDQLSQLLLVYLGMAADIVEIFETFKEDAVINNKELTYVILAIWSWSLLQFTLVMTATKARRPRLGGSLPMRVIYSKGESKPCFLWDVDIWGIMTTIILQDGPFLCIRLVLILYYNVVSYLNIFFTCKNILVTLLQIYRLFVLCYEGRWATEKKTNDKHTPNENIFTVPLRYKMVGNAYDKPNHCCQCKKTGLNSDAPLYLQTLKESEEAQVTVSSKKVQTEPLDSPRPKVIFVNRYNNHSLSNVSESRQVEYIVIVESIPCRSSLSRSQSLQSDIEEITNCVFKNNLEKTYDEDNESIDSKVYRKQNAKEYFLSTRL